VQFQIVQGIKGLSARNESDSDEGWLQFYEKRYDKVSPLYWKQHLYQFINYINT